MSCSTDTQKPSCVVEREGSGLAQAPGEKTVRKGHGQPNGKQSNWKEKNSVTVRTILGTKEAACMVVSSPSLIVCEQGLDRLWVGLL